MTEIVEMKRLLEKQLKLLSEQSEKSCEFFNGVELAALSEQLVNVGKFLPDIAPSANRSMNTKP